MIKQLKGQYFNQFKAQYNLFKSLNSTVTKQELFEKTCSFMDSFFSVEVETRVVENWKLELQKDYGDGGVVYASTPLVLRVNEPKGWYTPGKGNRFFWQRYQQYLVQKKNWEQNVIDVIDETTDEVLKSLGNPKELGPFDVRGLVLGYVQSGKTANFTGLINKSFDEGYKVAIILSGIHNDLRAQTQLRLEDEVIGQSNKGVGSIVKNDKHHFIQTLTTVNDDITVIPLNLSYNLSGNKTLLVVKKNKDVLEHLVKLLTNLIRQAGDSNIPVIIIDDEADQASIDTSDKTKGEDPKTINRLIREILMLFKQKAYVGYTATPFANLLIGANNETLSEGQDLYPKDFLVGLPKPEAYCGPDEFFNTAENADDNRPSLIIDIKEEDENLFKSIKKKDEHYKVDSVPPKLKEALLSFLIAVSVRNLRGNENDHNSMLIHTSRFTLVQKSLKEVVKEEFETIVNNVRYNPTSSDVQQVKELYYKEFVRKTTQWNQAMETNYDIFEWEAVYSVMRKIASKIDVMELNGDSEDALEYHKYKEDGLNVIAVGGDKLSRGLTLEGLSISYYYRNTLMYDTLMQMGRWFGYRKSYLDLCRIYTSNDIASNFEHLAIAMHQLREEFEKMKNDEKLTPSDYAVKMLAHPKMMLTSNLKMKNISAAYQNYSNKLHQTRLLSKEKNNFINNINTTVNLIGKIHNKIKAHEVEEKKTKTRYHVASDVDVNYVIEFLSNYKTYEGSTKTSSESIIEYIKLLNSKEYNELKSWKVVVVEGVPTKEVPNQQVQLGPLSLSYTVTRGLSADNIPNDRVDVKAIVAAKQQYFDEKKKSGSVSCPKLFIFPLNPHASIFRNVQNVGFNNYIVPIGFAIAFPSTDHKVNDNVYLKNKTINEKSELQK